MSWTVPEPAIGGSGRERHGAFSTRSFATTDLDEARDVLTRTYADHSLRHRGRSAQDLRLGHSVAASPMVSIGYSSFSADVEIAAPPFEDAYIVGFAARGQATMRSGVSTLIGRPVERPVRFDFEMDVADGPGAPFLRTLHLIEAELRRPDGMTLNTRLAERLSRLLVTSLSMGQPHDHADQVHAWAPAARSGPVRVAVEYIEAHAGEIATVAEIAKAACIGVRALEQGFRAQLGSSPMAFLRDVRLAGVHAELAAGEPHPISISAVARRWGFTHLSRFSQAYRRRYGVLPSQTLLGH